METQYDVFISYNTRDRLAVTQIAHKLRQCGLGVWLDDWEIRPGTSLMESIGMGVRSSRAVAVFIGPNDIGPWQRPEVEIAIREQISRKIPVIPAFLPGTTDDFIAKVTPFLSNNRWIDFRTGSEDAKALYNLRWGITGVKPEPDEPHEKRTESMTEPSRQDPVDDAVNNLAQLLRTKNVTFFLGPGAAFGTNPMPVQACDIARELLAELKIIESTYTNLLPPVDVAGMYYAIKSGDQNLESWVLSRMANTSKVFPTTHERLAALLKLLANRPARRGGERPPQLIVTTNLDLMMERALLRAGLPFTRLVQHRSAEQIDVNEYQHVRLNGSETVQLPSQSEAEGVVRADRNSFEELDWIIETYGKSSVRFGRDVGSGNVQNPLNALSFQKMPGLMLYKFRGSQDIPNSCVLSTSHHFEFARRVLQRSPIPEQITKIIGNSTILFLGLWFMDPDFRLIYHTLLHDAFKHPTDKSYALQLPPQYFTKDVYRQMESSLWEAIKDTSLVEMGIKTIEEPCDVFLSKLHIRVQAELRTGP